MTNTFHHRHELTTAIYFGAFLRLQHAQLHRALYFSHTGIALIYI